MENFHNTWSSCGVGFLIISEAAFLTDAKRPLSQV